MGGAERGCGRIRGERSEPPPPQNNLEKKEPRRIVRYGEERSRRRNE